MGCTEFCKMIHVKTYFNSSFTHLLATNSKQTALLACTFSSTQSLSFISQVLGTSSLVILLLPRGREKCSFPRGKLGRSVNFLTPKILKNEDEEFGIISGSNQEFYMLCWLLRKQKLCNHLDLKD